MTKVSLMKVESIAECSPWSILQYFWPASSDNWSWKPIFCLFESGRFTQVLLWFHYTDEKKCGPWSAGLEPIKSQLIWIFTILDVKNLKNSCTVCLSGWFWYVQIERISSCNSRDASISDSYNTMINEKKKTLKNETISPLTPHKPS